MLRIGYHVSSAGGYTAMGKRAAALGATTFAYFTRNPRGSAAKNIDPQDVAQFKAYANEHGIDNLVAHAPYTLNPCAAKPEVLEFAHLTMADDLQRMEYLPGQCYNFHPGCHVGQGVAVGTQKIVDLLNEVLFEQMHTTVLLETMAGKGSEIGGTFEELADIISGVQLKQKMGVCLDTCHVWDAGYDLEHDLDGVLTQLDSCVGLSRLKAIHLNNSLNNCGRRRDHHARLLDGKLSLEAIARIINHPALRKLPFILETPNNDEGYAAEISLLRQLAN